MYCYSCNTEKSLFDFYESDPRNCKACKKLRREELKKNRELGIPNSRPKSYNKRKTEFIGPPEPRKSRKKRKAEEWKNKNLSKIKNYYENKAEDLKKDRVENPKKYMIIRARNRSKEKSLDFNITEDDIFIPTHCPILGVKLIPNCKDRTHSMSIDRIDPSKGYVKGNVWVISNRANAMKNNADFEMLLAFAKWVFSISALTHEEVMNTV